MATTNTITEGPAGVTTHTYTALASNDTGPAIDCRGATEVLFQVTGGSFTTINLKMEQSLNGSNWVGNVWDAFQATTKIAGISAANGDVYSPIRVPPYLRIVCDSGTGSGIGAIVIVRRPAAF